MTPARWVLHYQGHGIWAAYFGMRGMADLCLIRGLEHEAAVMARIADALNKQHLGTPARTWTAREVAPGAWELDHNGVTCIGVDWYCEREDIPKGVERILEGLNVVEARSLPAAQPARPAVRHLRSVS